VLEHHISEQEEQHGYEDNPSENLHRDADIANTYSITHYIHTAHISTAALPQSIVAHSATMPGLTTPEHNPVVISRGNVSE